MSTRLDKLAAIILGSFLAFAALQAQAVGDGLDGLVGAWNLTGDSPYGPLQHRLVVGAGGRATYESMGEVSDVRNLEVDGDKISFEMTIFGGPNSYEMAFEGTFDDEGLTGELLSGGGGSFATLTAVRE